MHFECGYCKHEFDAPATPDRCPECMRRNGLIVIPGVGEESDPLDDLRNFEPAPLPELDLPDARAQARAGSGGRGRLWLLLALLVVLAALGLWMLGGDASQQDAGLHPGSPLDLPALERALTQRQARAGALELLLQPGGEVSSGLADLAGEAGPPEARAARQARALRTRLADAGLLPVSAPLQVRQAPPMTPADIWRRLDGPGDGVALYPLEAAALQVVALRALGLPAMLAEGLPAEDARRSLEPSGLFGYFVAVLPAGQGSVPVEARAEDLQVFDLLADEGGSGVARVRVLDDLQAVGAALSLRALHESEWQLDSRQAFESSGRALRLAPRQPWARTARALVTLSAGLSEQALQELEAAHQLRGDAPRKVQRAGLRMGMAELDEARSDLKQAVTQRPADVPARLMLARLALLDGDLDEAEAELRLASQSVPGVPAVERAWAGLQAARGQHGEALGRARASLESRPDMHGHLLVAQLYLAAGDGDRARDTAREALLMVPSYRRADLTEQLQRGLGLELSDDSGEQDSLGADLPAVSPDAVVQPGAGTDPVPARATDS